MSASYDPARGDCQIVFDLNLLPPLLSQLDWRLRVGGTLYQPLAAPVVADEYVTFRRGAIDYIPPAQPDNTIAYFATHSNLRGLAAGTPVLAFAIAIE